MKECSQNLIQRLFHQLLLIESFTSTSYHILIKYIFVKNNICSSNDMIPGDVE
jgi:hypothetical protein